MSKHRKKDQDTPAETPEGVPAQAVDEQAPPPDPLELARAEAAKNWDLYLRERAELENFRKRTQRDKEEFRIFTRKELLLEVLPVLDNLERALVHVGENGEGKGLVEGVTMTVAQFRKVIEDFGARPMASLGAPFDPNLHQAMGQLETDEQPPGTVVGEYQKGYLLTDRLLRPAMVVVAKAPAAPAAATEQATNDPKEDSEHE